MTRSLLVALALAAFLTACSDGEEASPADFPSAAPSTEGEWVEGSIAAQDGKHLVMRTAGGELLYIDTDLVRLFDCRTDCFTRATPPIARVEPGDRLCVHYLNIEAGHQTGKVWINRYSCPGRTIPP